MNIINNCITLKCTTLASTGELHYLGKSDNCHYSVNWPLLVQKALGQHELRLKVRVWHIIFQLESKPRSRVSFSLCVNTKEWRPYWQSRMEVSYCTSEFGVVIWPDLCALLLPCDSPCHNHYACVIKSMWKRQHQLGRLSCEKSGCTIIILLHSWSQNGC